MLEKIKAKILVMASLITVAMPMAAPALAVAAADPKQGACYGANNLQVATDPNSACAAIQEENGTGKVNKLITDVVNILSIIVGIAAVIMIIIGGFRYITSAGSAEKVTAAKNTILYALIGLVIVALSQVIVRFVLKQTT